MTSEETKVRLDKWLWAARFFKTRALASEAIAGGKVHVNGERVKPSKTVKVGEEMRVRQGRFEKHVLVDKVLARRGSASIAQTMYTETAESIALREKILEHERLIKPDYQAKRPDKHERQQIRKLKRS